MSEENTTPVGLGCRQRDDALQMGPRKKASVAVQLEECILNLPSSSNRCLQDPLVSYGRHFGRTVFALCNVRSLITNGMLRLDELSDKPDEDFTAEYALISYILSTPS